MGPDYEKDQQTFETLKLTEHVSFPPKAAKSDVFPELGDWIELIYFALSQASWDTG